MLELNKSYSDSKKILDELLIGSGVALFRDVFSIDEINDAREIVNKFADNQEQYILVRKFLFLMNQLQH